MNTLAKVSVVALVLTLIASCGGGSNAGTSLFGGGASGASGGGSSTASNLTLQLSTASIPNAGATTVTATATATTAAGQALAGIPVTFSVDNNATFTQASATTGSSGTTAAIVSIGADPSNRVITVKAVSGTLTATALFAVTGAKLISTALPAIAAPGSTGNIVNFQLLDQNSNPMTGQPISVTAGPIGTTTGTTDVNGDYSYVYTAPGTAGSLDVVGTAGGTSSTQTVAIQSGKLPDAAGPIKSASVSANPSVVATNTAASSNQTEIRALFVGSDNAPIQNVRVVFDLNGDVNSVGGTFSTGTNVVYTDANGVATTAYIPGARSSPTNGLTIRACYSTTDFTTPCPNAVTTTVTVVSEPLAVSIGSNNVVLIGPTNLTYIRQFVVLVVDAAGNAKANVNIVPSIDLDYYYKGQYVQPGSWIQGYIGNPNTIPVQIVAAPPWRCLNEDLNRSGVMLAGEDLNHNGQLDPRKSDATITILGSGQTDASGSAVVQVEYPQNVGSWLHVNITVSATGVSGTEGRAIWSEVLPIPASVLAETPSPPFQLSPYGIDITPLEIIFPGDPRLSLDAMGNHNWFPDGTTPPATAIDPCHNPY
jgi:hypothetical protein